MNEPFTYTQSEPVEFDPHASIEAMREFDRKFEAQRRRDAAFIEKATAAVLELDPPPTTCYCVTLPDQPRVMVFFRSAQLVLQVVEDSAVPI